MAAPLLDYIGKGKEALYHSNVRHSRSVLCLWTVNGSLWVPLPFRTNLGNNLETGTMVESSVLLLILGGHILSAKDASYLYLPENET